MAEEIILFANKRLTELVKKKDNIVLGQSKYNIKNAHKKILENQLKSVIDEIKAYSPKDAQLEMTELCKEIEKVKAFLKVLTNVKEDGEGTEKDGKGSKRKRENQVTQDTKEEGEETEEDGEDTEKDGKSFKRKRENQVAQYDKMAKYRPPRVSSDPSMTRAKRATVVGSELKDYYTNNSHSLIDAFKMNIDTLVVQDQQKDSKECVDKYFYCLLCDKSRHRSDLQNQIKHNPVPLGGGSFACKYCVRKIA